MLLHSNCPLHTKIFLLMGSKHLLRRSLSPLPISSFSLYHHHLHTLHRLNLLPSPIPPKPISDFLSFSQSKHGFCYAALSNRVPRPVLLEEQTSEQTRLRILRQKLEQLGIPSATSQPGEEIRKFCPQCEGGTSKERSLSVLITADCDEAKWHCFRGKCGWRGYIGAQGNAISSSFQKVASVKKSNIKRVITEENLGLEDLSEELLAYFADKMISGKTLQRNRVKQKPGHEVTIAFTYRRNGMLVTCKYRDMDSDEDLGLEKNTEEILYGLDDIENANDIIIVAGEIDKLSMEEVGFLNCVSVPHVALPQVSDKELPPPDEDKKYQYLWNCEKYLAKASRIILATDADQPGQALAEELARRLGRERCWRVRWPKKNDVEVCKDANEVLTHLGSHALREVVDKAELYPIRGLFNFRDFFDEIDAYYHCSMGYELGVSTGWRDLNDLYKVVPGELTIVTGVPNSGKSEWIDALLCNINQREGWKFALCSMENKVSAAHIRTVSADLISNQHHALWELALNSYFHIQVREHARKLMEKYIQRPFFGARYAESVERMSVDEYEQGKKWLNDTFYLIRCEDDCLPSIKWVLELAKSAVLRHGVRGLVIDPYNELDHQRPPNQTETEYVSQMLTKIKRFAQHHSCHVWFVAHPRQLHNWVGGPPNLYDISGSAHFINKCDNGIVVHRNRDPERGPIDQVEICVRKVRNKVVGQIGDAKLSYCRVTGSFHDTDPTTNTATTTTTTTKVRRR